MLQQFSHWVFGLICYPVLGFITACILEVTVGKTFSDREQLVLSIVWPITLLVWVATLIRNSPRLIASAARWFAGGIDELLQRLK